MATTTSNPLLSIAATPATSQAKKYLMYYGSDKLSPDVIVTALEKANLQNPNDCDLLHLQVYLFINHPTVQELLGRFRKQLLPLTPLNKIDGGITLDFYLELVFHLNLHEQLLQMILASSENDLSSQIMDRVVELLTNDIDNINWINFDSKTMKLYLSALAQLCTQDGGYMTKFKNFFNAWMNHSSSIPISKFDKIQTLLRVIGLVHLIDTDVDTSSEIGELLTTTDFDGTKQLRDGKTFNLFQVFYPITSTNGRTGSQLCQAFEALVKEFCTQDAVELSDQEKVELSAGPENGLSLLGQYAYICKLILQYQPENKPEFEELANFWVQFKPKVSFEDFQEVIQCFEDVCKLLPIYAVNPRYQQRWFEEFLRYPESCRTPAGHRVLEAVIAPTANLELSLPLVSQLNAALDDAGEGVRERINRIILIVARNSYEHGWKDELVERVYKGYAHDKFTTFGFEFDLQELLVKAGSLEFDPKAKFLGGVQISNLAKGRNEYCGAVFRLFFENPIESTLSLVPLSIRERKFQILHYIKPFLNLTVDKTEIADLGLNEFPREVNLLEYSLLSILLSTNEKDSLMEACERNLSLLVKEELLSFEQLYQIVFSVFERTLCMEDFGRWLKIFRVWASLFEYLIDNKTNIDDESVEVFVEDILHIPLYTTFLMKAINHQPILEGLERCLEMIEHAKKNGLYQRKVEENISDFYDADMCVRKLGFLWFRCHASWALVTKYLLTTPSLLDTLTEYKLIICLVPWITNSCRLEWNSVLDFVENLIKLKSAKGSNAIRLHSVVNHALIVAMQPTIRMSHYLAFYAHYLRRQQALETYRKENRVHVSTVATLVLFIQKIHNPPADDEESSNSGRRIRRVRDEYRSGLVQQSLLLLHEFVEWMILNSVDFENIQERCLELVPDAIPTIEAEGCFSSMSIYEAIMTKLKRGKDDVTVFERNVSTMHINVNGGAAGESCVQVKVPVKAGLKAEILDKYVNYYEHQDEYEKSNGNQGEEDAKDDTKNLYPFHNTATEIGAKLNVQLKFDEDEEE